MPQGQQIGSTSFTVEFVAMAVAKSMGFATKADLKAAVATPMGEQGGQIFRFSLIFLAASLCQFLLVLCR